MPLRLVAAIGLATMGVVLLSIPRKDAATLAAARRFADVVSTDYVGTLLAHQPLPRGSLKAVHAKAAAPEHVEEREFERHLGRGDANEHHAACEVASALAKPDPRRGPGGRPRVAQNCCTYSATQLPSDAPSSSSGIGAESSPPPPMEEPVDMSSMVERLAGRPAILRKPFDINSLGEAVAVAMERAREDQHALSGA